MGGGGWGGGGNGNVVMRMGTLQQHNNQDRYVIEVAPPRTWTLLCSVWCIT